MRLSVQVMLLPQFVVVVNFAIENDAVAVAVMHGLHTAGFVYNTQPGMKELNIIGLVNGLVVGPAVL
jgi:hypothetical protein